MNTASHSNEPTARPELAPEPARPMKCSLEMLAAKSDARSYGELSAEAFGEQATIVSRIEATLVRSLEPAELQRAFRASVDVLLTEIAHVDAELAVRLDRPLRELA